MLGIHPISAYLLAVGLLTLLAAILAWQAPRSGKTVVVWFLSGVVGILLGSVLPLAAVYLGHYEVVKAAVLPNGSMVGGQAPGPGMGGPPGMGGMPGMAAPPGLGMMAG